MRLFQSISFAVAVSIFGGAHAAVSDCKLLHARYVFSSNHNWTLQFKLVKSYPGWPTNVVLKISGKNKGDYWFLFDQGSSRYINLISTADVEIPGWKPPTDDSSTRPLGEMHYFAWTGSNDQFLVEVPKQDDNAPQAILLPDLPEKLAYVANPRVEIAQGIFHLKRCE